MSPGEVKKLLFDAPVLLARVRRIMSES